MNVRRRAARAIARWHGYFWLPCPICGRRFAGFEWTGTLHETYNRGTSTCPRCPGDWVLDPSTGLYEHGLPPVPPELTRWAIAVGGQTAEEFARVSAAHHCGVICAWEDCGRPVEVETSWGQIMTCVEHGLILERIARNHGLPYANWAGPLLVTLEVDP